MKAEIKFFVPGIPRPKGSMKPTGGKHRMANQSRHTKPWQDLIGYIANTKKPRELLDGPIETKLEFLFPKPKNPRHPYWPVTQRNDIEKLIRTVHDALTGIIWVDDGYVVRSTQEKRYADAEVGVYITIKDLSRIEFS